MKTLYNCISLTLLLILAVGCSAPATSAPATSAPATSTTAPTTVPATAASTPTSLPASTPTVPLPTETQAPTTAISVEADWAFNGGSTPFFYPSAIAIDAQDNVYVADTRNQRIVKIDSQGQFVTEWGSAGEGNGQFISPTGVAIDGQGNVYVAEAGYDRVQKFDPDGNFVTQWGGTGSRDQSGHPAKIAVDGQGQVFVADPRNYHIQKFDSDGKSLAEWGGQGDQDGQFMQFGGLAVDPQGNLYVADATNARISKFDNNGQFLLKWKLKQLTCKFPRTAVGPAEIQAPAGMWFDPEGHLSIADSSGGRICTYDEGGTFLGGWGGKGFQPGQLSSPVDLVGDSAGNIYVLDYSTNQVQKFKITK